METTEEVQDLHKRPRPYRDYMRRKDTVEDRAWVASHEGWRMYPWLPGALAHSQEDPLWSVLLALEVLERRREAPMPAFASIPASLRESTQRTAELPGYELPGRADVIEGVHGFERERTTVGELLAMAHLNGTDDYALSDVPRAVRLSLPLACRRAHIMERRPAAFMSLDPDDPLRKDVSLCAWIMQHFPHQFAALSEAVRLQPTVVNAALRTVSSAHNALLLLNAVPSGWSWRRHLNLDMLETRLREWHLNAEDKELTAVVHWLSAKAPEVVPLLTMGRDLRERRRHFRRLQAFRRRHGLDAITLWRRSGHAKSAPFPPP